jgi:ketosteroid isomerase-like protein
MSQENLELARRGFEAWEQGDLETHLGLIHEDVVCCQVGGIESKTYHGLEGYVEFASQWVEPYQDLQFQPSEFIDAGDKVFIEVPQQGRLVGSDQLVSGTFWFVITVRDRKMIRLETHRERDRALEAAGLSE